MTEPLADISPPARTPPAPPVPDPTFTVLDAEAVRHAASPTLRFTGHVTEPEGREVYAIALSVQVMVEPGKRGYDDEARARMVELFGAPERWAGTTNSFLWAELDVLVPGFTGASAFRMPLACTFDQEVAAPKYLDAVRDGAIPLAFNFTGRIFYRGEAGRLQVVNVPWDASAKYALPARVWQEMIAHHYPNGRWVRVGEDTLTALAARKAQRGDMSFDETVAALLEETER